LGFDGVNFGKEDQGNFETKGVTSIGVSLNKYGLGSPGTSCLLYKTRILRKSQYYAHYNWNGGMYTSPNLSGSRYGSAIAATWVKMLGTGKNIYTKKANDIIDSTLKLRADLKERSGHLDILTEETLSVLAFKLKNGDSYNLADFLRSKGFNVVNTINPQAISLTVTEVNKEMLPDLKKFIDEYIKNYLEKNAKYEGEGIQKFYESRDTLLNYIHTKFDLPDLMKNTREEIRLQ